MPGLTPVNVSTESLQLHFYPHDSPCTLFSTVVLLRCACENGYWFKICSNSKSQIKVRTMKHEEWPYPMSVIWRGLRCGRVIVSNQGSLKQ